MGVLAHFGLKNMVLKGVTEPLNPKLSYKDPKPPI